MSENPFLADIKNDLYCGIEVGDMRTRIYFINSRTNERHNDFPFPIQHLDADTSAEEIANSIRAVRCILGKQKSWRADAKIERVCILSPVNDINYLDEVKKAICKENISSKAGLPEKISWENEIETMLKYHVPEGGLAIGLHVGVDVQCAVYSNRQTSSSSDASPETHGGARWISREARLRSAADETNSFERPQDPEMTLFPCAEVCRLFMKVFSASGEFETSCLVVDSENRKLLSDFGELITRNLKETLAAGQPGDPAVVALVKDAGEELGSIVLQAMNRHYSKADKEVVDVLICGDVERTTLLVSIEGFASKFNHKDMKTVKLYRPREPTAAVAAIHAADLEKITLKMDPWEEVYNIVYTEDGHKIVKIV
ncbi:unnamed protein product [Caenorhabditis sp. 36 PRJEB53466]|nr:unnamed protein product [Caenorhabditis sp. 36 PRJEB53466]